MLWCSIILDGYRSMYAACQAIGPKVGVGADSLSRWTLQTQVDDSAELRPRGSQKSNENSAIAWSEQDSKGTRFFLRGSSTPSATTVDQLVYV
jgi:hypothetical protein